MNLYLYATLVFFGTIILKIVLDWIEERELGTAGFWISNALYGLFEVVAIFMTPGFEMIVYYDGGLITKIVGFSNLLLYSIVPSLIGVFIGSIIVASTAQHRFNNKVL